MTNPAYVLTKWTLTECAETTPRAIVRCALTGAGCSHLHPTGPIGAGQRGGRGFVIRGSEGLHVDERAAHPQEVGVLDAKEHLQLRLVGLVGGADQRVQPDRCYADDVSDKQAFIDAAERSVEIRVDRGVRVEGHAAQHRGVGA